MIEQVFRLRVFWMLLDEDAVTLRRQGPSD
jgi:hypothetical protein